MARRALILANGDFADMRITALQSPVSDGKRLKALLERPDVGGYDVTLCADCDAGAIKLQTERFFGSADPDDLLLMLVSGHGMKDRRGNLHFIARDTQVDALAATGVEARFFHDRMRDSPATKQIVFVDTCYSGAFAKDANFKSIDVSVAQEDFTGDTQAADEDEGIAIFTASAGNQLAQEKASECGQQGVQSQFTRHIIDGIETGQADPQGTGWITLENLFTYARRGLKKDGIGQTPQRLLSRLPGSVQLARNPVALAELPEDIEASLHHQDSLVRAGSVDKLLDIANGADQLQARLAVAALRKLSFDETVLVTTAAQRALARLGLSQNADDSAEKAREGQEQLRLLESERLALEKAEREQHLRETEETERQKRERTEETELERKRQALEAREAEAHALEAEREKQRRKHGEDSIPEPAKKGFPTWLKWAGGLLALLIVAATINGNDGLQPAEYSNTTPTEVVPPATETPEPAAEPSANIPEPSAVDPSPAADLATPTRLSLLIAGVAAQERALLPIPLANDWRITAVRTSDTQIEYDSSMDLSASEPEIAAGRPAARAMLAMLTCATPGLNQVITAGGSVQFNVATSNGIRFSETISSC